MRSIKTQRKSRASSRAKPSRRGQTGTRPPTERVVLGKKTPARGGFIARARNLATRFSLPRRPMLHLSWLLIVATLIAALFAGGYVSGAFKNMRRGADNLVADAGFGISSVQLSGNSRTSRQSILAALGFERGQSIFSADIQTARLRLLALDWVADAQVRRQFPDSVAVSIVEKLPFALWQSPDGLFVVERSGRVITKAQVADFPHLPLFLGKGGPEAGAELVDAIALHRAVAARVKAMERVSERRWNLLLDGDVVVKLPETGWAKQLDELEHLIVDKGVLERDISEIDLRLPDNFLFQRRDGGEQQVTRGNAT